MKWIRLWVEEIYCGTTFEELDFFERGVWFSLLVAAGVRSNNGVIPEVTIRRLNPVKRADRNQRFTNAVSKLHQLDKILILPNGDIEIKNWDKYQTRFEKYYKGKTKPIQGKLAYTCHPDSDSEEEEE
jgi:hypothetical protein